MNIYKTDSLHRHVILDTGGSRNSHTPTQHEFDLPNNHSYNEKGELLKERGLGAMDFDFCHKLARITPVERVEDFLDYQFEFAEDKIKFLKHINTGAIINSFQISQKPARQQVLIDWIKEKKKQLEQLPTNKDFEREKQSFAKTYGSFETPQEKKSFLIGHILKTKKCIEQFLIEPHLIGEGFEPNRKYFSEANLFLNYLEEIERKDFPTEEDKESKQETFEPLEFDNLSQKLLLLESLGVLKAISETTGENISSRKMGRIIADILELKETTITRALRGFNLYTQPKGKNNPRTETNLSALHANLVKLKLPKLESEVAKLLSEVMTKED